MKKQFYLLLPVVLLIICWRSSNSYFPTDIDHATVLRSLNKTTLEKGRRIYESSCLACHGANGTSSYPQARSFSKDNLHFGNKPCEMWRTVTNGAGLMAPQTWLSSAERYYVIQYIRETFMKKANPAQYFTITEKYLASLPKTTTSANEQAAITKTQALKGYQKYGQDWFLNHNSNYGTAIHSQLKNHTTSAFTITLDNQIKISYNLLRMGITAAWQGELNLAATKYKKYRREGEPVIQGKLLKEIDCWQWTYNDKLDSLQNATGVRSPLPKAFLDYHGHYVFNKKVILSYAIGGRDVFELPEALTVAGNIVLAQTLSVTPGTSSQKLIVGHLSKDDTTNPGNTRNFSNIAIVTSAPGIYLSVDVMNNIVLTIPGSAVSQAVQVLKLVAKNKQAITSFSSYITSRNTNKIIPNLADMTKGSKPQWTKITETKGVLNANRAHIDPTFRKDAKANDKTKLVSIPADYPYTIDNITLPFNNAYNAWIRPTCLGFKSDGTLLLGTYTGDVWEAKGIDDNLEHIRWRRIATGLFEPMGLKIVQDKIYVTTRNGIVLLHDLNADGETDFYENFFADEDISSFFHAFNFSLETDREGNFYYAKPGEYTDNKDPGNLMKISPDGKKSESLATGFRVNNGVTVAPDDRIFVSDNQGNWMPANKINLIEKGAFYGYVPNLTSGGQWSPDGRIFTKDQLVNDVISPEIVKVPESFYPPVIWLPQEFDNSPGGGVWTDASWGPYGNQFLHTSYGTGWAYYFMTQKVNEITQGAMVALPFQLDAGIQRAAVNPADKQVYVTGLTGWDDAQAVQYGVLSRIRYKGGDGHLIKDVAVVKGGIQLTFNFPLDENLVKNTANYSITQWNYKWTSNYGSADYSIREKGKEGTDKLVVNGVVLSPDGKSILLQIPELGPAQTVRLRLEVTGKDRTKIKDNIYLTIHKIPE